MSNITVQTLIIAVCILLSGFFSATETAFSSLNLYRIKTLAEKGDKKAERILYLLEHFDGLLSTILVGNNVVNIFCSAIATVMFVRLCGQDSGTAVATLVTTVLVLMFGEIAPKSLAKRAPEKFAMAVCPVIHAIYMLLTPVNFLFRAWTSFVQKLFPGKSEEVITEDDLYTIVEEAKQDGSIDEQESEIIRNAIEFNEMEVEEIFKHRVDVVAISLNATEEEIVKTFRETGYSRIPVFEEDIDDVIGILVQKDFYNQIYQTGRSITETLQKPIFVTRQMKIGELMRKFQKEQKQMAIVVDEFGGTMGIVTLEDILEELVGEIWDENEVAREEIRKVSDNVYEVSGSANVEKLFEVLGQEKEFDTVTVGGWVMDVMERVPKAGDSFYYENFRITVLEMDDNRVMKIRLEVIEIQKTEG